MSKARHLGNLLDTGGDVVSGSLDNVTVDNSKISGMDASKLTGTIADARIPSTALNSSVMTKSTSEPAMDTNPSGGVGTVWLRTTTGEMYCCTDATTDANVWTNIGSGTGDVSPTVYTVATGGTITTDGDYKVHTFDDSGDFVVTQVGSAGVGDQVDYMIIAGGGGGGKGESANVVGSGGCGAGGLIYNTSQTVTATTYGIVVGGGGAGATSVVHGASGTNSTGFGQTAYGGGSGGAYAVGYRDGVNGGSGGGCCYNSSTPGTGVAGQGYAGGDNAFTSIRWGDGGGGAGGVGGDSAEGQAGIGGIGRSIDISGTATYYASGGGGGANYSSTAYGTASDGGGGNGGPYNADTAENGAVNTGGGAGGNGGAYNGKNGGSGKVIIRYKFQ